MCHRRWSRALRPHCVARKFSFEEAVFRRLGSKNCSVSLPAVLSTETFKPKAKGREFPREMTIDRVSQDFETIQQTREIFYSVATVERVLFSRPPGLLVGARTNNVKRGGFPDWNLDFVLARVSISCMHGRMTCSSENGAENVRGLPRMKWPEILLVGGVREPHWLSALASRLALKPTLNAAG